MQFDDHPPKDSADFVPDEDHYKPTHFVTTALNLTKVRAVWSGFCLHKLKMRNIFRPFLFVQSLELVTVKFKVKDALGLEENSQISCEL